MSHHRIAVTHSSTSKNSRRTNNLTFLVAVLISTIILIAPIKVGANDSTAALGAGGIELTKNEHIRILEEHLEISPHLVRVQYKFLNESDQDIHTKVAFPLPRYDGVANANISIGDPNEIFRTLRLWIENKLIPVERERKALLNGRDITDRLRRLGLSDKEIFFDVSEAEKGDLWDKLKLFLPKIGNWWDISLMISWDMAFPARKEIVVAHEYEPATGGGYAPWTDQQNFFGGKQTPTERFEDIEQVMNVSGKQGNEDCLDDRTKRTIENRVKMAVLKGAGLVYVSYDKVKYILGIGRNWKGPIGEFTLRLVKETPDQLVSLCFPGKPEKISPTVYEFKQKEFVPQDNLVVYFYTVRAD